jgi:methionyl-tRNA formyltransferase
LKDAAFLDGLAELGAELGVVAAYGRILTEAVLAVPPLGLLNVHASLLPRYRGAAPVHRAVMAGDAQTGVTIMRVVLALDAGPMLSARRRPVGPDETSEEVERDLAVIGAELLVATLDRVAAGQWRETPQDESAATYAPRLAREDGVIDWSRSALDIHDQIRGLYPWPHAFSYVDGRRVIFLRSHPVGASEDARAGTVVEARGDRLRVATGSGSLEILSLQPEGKRAMAPRDFLAGYPLAPGARFGPPA